MKRYMKTATAVLLSLLLMLGTVACQTTTPETSTEESVPVSEVESMAESEPVIESEPEQPESSETIENSEGENAETMNTTTAGESQTTAPASSKPAETKPTEGTKAPQTTVANTVVTRAPQTTEAPSNSPVRVLATQQPVDILRTDADAQRRLVYLKFTNFEGKTHKDCVLTYTEGGKTYTRDIFTIYLNEKVVYDTVWLKSDTKSVTGFLKDGNGRELWKGTITVIPSDTKTVIKKTTVYNESNLKPGTMRGVDYYPRYTPWSAWTAQDPKVWDSEFTEISEKLHANAIRTFAECWETDKLLGNCATPHYIDTLNNLFGVAEKHGIGVLFCLYSGDPNPIMSYNQRYVRSIVEPFINDGRVLCWDLINEIDSKGLSDSEVVDNFCLTCYPLLSEIDPNHLNQIGFAFMLDKAVKIGLTFDKPNQSWQYHYYRKTNADNIGSWIQTYFKDRPFILGECGDTTATEVYDGAPRDKLGEEWQLDVYKTLTEAYNEAVARGYKMLGMYAWTAFDFPGFGGSSGQGEYGLIREDGSLKPAGKHLGEEYLKMKQSRPAQWDK